MNHFRKVCSTYERRMLTPHRLYVMLELKTAKLQDADTGKAYLRIDRFTLALHSDGSLDGKFSVRKIFHGPLD